MNKEDIQKLIGGYATGSLTGEERLKLFEAALEDQELFDALQQEQSLKDLFDDPFSRELVRRAAAESLPPPQTSRRTSWFRQPWIWASATSVALAAVLVVALVRWDRTPSGVEKQVAQTVKQTPEQPAPPTAQPAAPPAVQPPAPLATPPTNRAATVRERPQRIEPKAETPKPPADHAEATARLDRPGEVSKESPRGNLGTGTGAGGGGDKRKADSVQLAQNREHDMRDAVAPPRSYDAPRKDDQAATQQSPAPPSQNQLERGRQGAAIAPVPSPALRSQSQDQLGQRQQGPPPPQQLRQSEPVQVQAQAPPVPPAVAAPESRSKTADEDKPRNRAITTETAVETKSARTPQSKSMALGNAAGLAKKTAAMQEPIYSLARRAENGTFVEVPADTVFRTGEIVRVIIAPRISGSLSIWESDAANPEWKLLFPATDSKKVSLRASKDYSVPVDIVVQKDQRLRG